MVNSAGGLSPDGIESEMYFWGNFADCVKRCFAMDWAMLGLRNLALLSDCYAVIGNRKIQKMKHICETIAQAFLSF